MGETIVMCYLLSIYHVVIKMCCVSSARLTHMMTAVRQGSDASQHIWASSSCYHTVAAIYCIFSFISSLYRMLPQYRPDASLTSHRRLLGPFGRLLLLLWSRSTPSVLILDGTRTIFMKLLSYHRNACGIRVSSRWMRILAVSLLWAVVSILLGLLKWRNT